MRQTRRDVDDRAGPAFYRRLSRRVKARRVTQPNDPGELARMAQRVIELKLEHRDLDAAIAAAPGDTDADELTVKRLKKRKLQLKDCIAKLESALIPDEPA